MEDKNPDWLEIYTEYSPDLEELDILAIGECDGKPLKAIKKLYKKNHWLDLKEDNASRV